MRLPRHDSLRLTHVDIGPLQELPCVVLAGKGVGLASLSKVVRQGHRLLTLYLEYLATCHRRQGGLTSARPMPHKRWEHLGARLTGTLNVSNRPLAQLISAMQDTDLDPLLREDRSLRLLVYLLLSDRRPIALAVAVTSLASIWRWHSGATCPRFRGASRTHS